MFKWNFIQRARAGYLLECFDISADTIPEFQYIRHQNNNFVHTLL